MRWFRAEVYRLQNMTHCQNLIQSLQQENPNAKFLHLGYALYVTIQMLSEEAKVNLEKKISEMHDLDLISYYEYLKKREEGARFSVSRILNPALAALHIDSLSRFALLRINVTKLRLANILSEILENYSNRIKCSNKINFNTEVTDNASQHRSQAVEEEPEESSQRSATGGFPPSWQHLRLKNLGWLKDARKASTKTKFSNYLCQYSNPKAAEEFYYAHKIQLNDDERQSDTNMEEEIDRVLTFASQTLNTSKIQLTQEDDIDKTFLFHPLREFHMPADFKKLDECTNQQPILEPDAHPDQSPFWMANASLRGLPYYSRAGKVGALNLAQENYQRKDKRKLIASNPLISRFGLISYYPKNVTYTTPLLYFKSMTLKFFYEGNHSDLTENVPPLILKTHFHLLNQDGKTYAQCLSMTEPTYILRSKGANHKYVSEFSLLRGIARNELYAWQLLTHLLTKNTSVLVDPVLYIQDLLLTDRWSLYLDIDVLEATPFILTLNAMANYLISIALTSLDQEMQDLTHKSLAGDKNVERILLHYFPDGSYRGKGFCV